MLTHSARGAGTKSLLPFADHEQAAAAAAASAAASGGSGSAVAAAAASAAASNGIGGSSAAASAAAAAASQGSVSQMGRTLHADTTSCDAQALVERMTRTQINLSILLGSAVAMLAAHASPNDFFVIACDCGSACSAGKNGHDVAAAAAAAAASSAGGK